MAKHNEENKNQEVNILDEIYASFKDPSMWYLLILFLIAGKPRIPKGKCSGDERKNEREK